MTQSVPPSSSQFFPAETTPEAIARIFDLTGAEPKARGEKRALVALRDALDLDVDIVRTNSVFGARLAEVLGVDWDVEAFTESTKVNLIGLNALLEGAHRAVIQGRLRPLQSQIPATLDSEAWRGFQPAISKIEAVTRIARLTNAPDEWLGPGAKEHKSVLTNLADRMLPGVPLERSSKTKLARSIADILGAPWSDDCYSTGETISLLGLNVILAGAERRLGLLGSSTTDLLETPEEEGRALTSALRSKWTGDPWDARESILWMRDSDLRGYNESEWQGWYFESRGREILNEAFPPSPRPPQSRYGNTVFDYRLNRVWDLKVHTAERLFPISGARRRGNPEMILNDAHAVRSCVTDQGLGFLVLSGSAVMDEGQEFAVWHDAFKSTQGLTRAPSNSGRSRTRKSAFEPASIEAFWIADAAALDAAVIAGQLKVRAQGRQPPSATGGVGAPRKDKFHMQIDKARSGLSIDRKTWEK